MIKKPKVGKIAIVVFLTVLIWVWADLAQDETLTLRNFVTMSVARSSDPALWITFDPPDLGLQTTVTIDNVDLRGPVRRVTDVERMKNKGALELDLFLDAEREGMNESGTRTLNVLNFLKQSDEIDQLGLTVESCEPQNLTVQVRRLVERSLPVQCVDRNGNLIQAASLQPATVTAYVMPDVTYTARIELSEADQNQAKVATIQRVPYVDLAAGQRRTLSASPVNITLPREQVALADYNVQATLGFCFSPILQGQYRVELDPAQNIDELAAVRVRATRAAFDAFSNRQPFQIYLPILDSDRDVPDYQERRVVFDLPDDYVRRGEIEETEDPAPLIRFRLVHVAEDAPEGP